MTRFQKLWSALWPWLAVLIFLTVYGLLAGLIGG